ncbi:helix-turn-helix domain-containing protein [Rhodospirillaceae bacterium KN72]|uniref:Helix-turn-helix domain-containing protein n=1 Tax=Pacificispira spongiicola TaxID=2729598 RepID=A0A7Y0HHG7_9PROT|nr:AraC family transcriptional regulator [Pacificispira spongiicola]NMM45474.1 helix-turn-helix domain-containing protein [Pacificispira spongiicola]
MKRPTRIRLQATNSLPRRKVLITVPRAWIESVLLDCSAAGVPAPEAFVQHRFHGAWQPSRHALALAEQLINPASDLPMLKILAAESKATEITREALRSILNTGYDSDTAPMTLEASRAKTVREFILAHQVEGLPLGVIAERLGMSIGSMQAAFKATYRITIGAFIREQRLFAAREAIEQDGKRVSEAAYLAGYDNPGSFSTAFRRQFGFPPSNCKR